MNFRRVYEHTLCTSKPQKIGISGRFWKSTESIDRGVLCTKRKRNARMDEHTGKMEIGNL